MLRGSMKKRPLSTTHKPAAGLDALPRMRLTPPVSAAFGPQSAESASSAMMTWLAEKELRVVLLLFPASSVVFLSLLLCL